MKRSGGKRYVRRKKILQRGSGVAECLASRERKYLRLQSYEYMNSAIRHKKGCVDRTL